MQGRLPFREWTRLVMLWSMTCPDHPSRKAAAVTLVLRGTAQRIAMAIPPQAMLHGGQVNGVHVDALTFLLHTLAERFGPLGEESRMKAMVEIFNFDRKPGESIDELLTRFDLTRQTAANEGGI